MSEEPMDRWERRQGAKADDAAREAKLDRLERAYLRAYESALAQIVRAWGLDRPGRPSP
jgi:hypothetical protein